MISVEGYLTQHAAAGAAPAFVEQNAIDLLGRVNALTDDSRCPVRDPGLRSGWRPPAYNASVPGAAPNSGHITGHSIDLDDNDCVLDNWLTDELLAEFGLYREHPSQTQTWVHLQSYPPKSGKRTFFK